MQDFDFNFNQFNQFNQNKQKGQSLLAAGWRPLNRDFDWSYFLQLAQEDSEELNRRMMGAVSTIADALGRSHQAWWSNAINLFSSYTRGEIDQVWNYLTPDPPYPDYRYRDTLSVETPIRQIVSRNNIPIDYVLTRLQETTIRQTLAILGRPDLIMQSYLDRSFYFPVERFESWDRLDVVSSAYAYWAAHEVWLQIDYVDRGRRYWTLMAKNMAPLIQKSTYGLAVMLSGYQSRVGQIHAQFAVRDFPPEIQAFTDTVQQTVMNQHRLAVLVHGDPGTGKTAWTQAIAKEVLVPLGYVIFILDHDAVENFVPPSYLERICLIINEADNLAQDRSTEIAQSNNKTEHILSLLDGTLYQSVVSVGNFELEQKLVVLMTCNTTERLDPAMLRKGRVDLMCEFNHRFV
ncbi:ATP-binding protein [Leptolyngbya sp. DQ-M1]|uniref:AAA family ATPase n=1 Tax=Leptolyngbya sp. DQ-M1 TaxID=2933920 RepID=UPI0032968636